MGCCSIHSGSPETNEQSVLLESLGKRLRVGVRIATAKKTLEKSGLLDRPGLFGQSFYMFFGPHICFDLTNSTRLLDDA